MDTMVVEINQSTLIGCPITVGRNKKQWIIRRVNLIKPRLDSPIEEQIFCILAAAPLMRANHRIRIRSFIFSLEPDDFHGELRGENDWCLFLDKKRKVTIHIRSVNPVISLSC